MKKINVLLIAIMAVFVMISCGGDDRFNEVEYFKDAQKSRIYCVQTDVNDQSELRQWADYNAMNTTGCITRVYFYKPGETIPPITTSPNLARVYEELDQSNYFIIYMKHPSGEVDIFSKTK